MNICEKHSTCFSALLEPPEWITRFTAAIIEGVAPVNPLVPSTGIPVAINQPRKKRRRAGKGGGSAAGEQTSNRAIQPEEREADIQSRGLASDRELPAYGTVCSPSW